MGVIDVEPVAESLSTTLLMRLANALQAANDPDDVALRVLAELDAALSNTASYILLLNPDRQVRVGYIIRSGAVKSVDAELCPRLLHEGLPGWVAQSGQAALIHDSHLDPRPVWMPATFEVRSALAVPIQHRASLLGVLVLLHQDVQQFSTTTLPLITAVAAQAGLALYAVRTVPDERQYHSHVRSIASISQSLSTRMSVQELTRELLERCATILASSCATLYLEDHTDHRLHPVDFYVPALAASVYAAVETVLPAIQHLAERAWSERTLITESLDELAGLRLTCVALPLLYGDVALGTLLLAQPAQESTIFPQGDWPLLTTFANVAAVAFANLNLIEQLRLRTTELEYQVVHRAGQVQRSRDLLRVVFDHLADGLVLMDVNTHILTANHAFCKGILNLEPTMVVGRRYDEVFAAATQDSSIHIQLQEDGRVLRTDAAGQQYWYDLTRYEVRSPESGEPCVMERWYDVTRQETLYRQVLEQAQYTSLGRLASSVVHEVGNPLQSVRSCIELTVELSQMPPASLRYLHLGLQELDRITQLLERLRALYRRPDFSWTDVQLNTMVQEVCHVVQHQFQRRQITLTHQLDPALPVIRGQPDALRQVLLTLLLNQQALTVEGGTMHITTAYEDAPYPKVVVHISSIGQGTMPDRLAFVSDTDELDASGTGMYLSRRVIEQHGGTLQTRLFADGHTALIIRLPCQEGLYETGHYSHR